MSAANLSLNTNSPRTTAPVGKSRHANAANAKSARSSNTQSRGSRGEQRYSAKAAGGQSGKADASMSWRKPLSVDAKPFLPIGPAALSAEAPAFTPSKSDLELEVKDDSLSSGAPVLPALKTETSTPKAGARFVSPSFRSVGNTPRTPRTPGGEEKYDYFSPYDVGAPKEFRVGIDAIYGLPFGGSLAFVFDGSKAHTVCKTMGSGAAEMKVQVNEKLTVEVFSGGMHDGDKAKILINGNDYCPNQKGVNILVVDTKTLDAYVGVFDTHTHIGNESSHLTRFLTAIPETHIVLIAVRYDAARRMHPEARQALMARGVQLPDTDNALALEQVVKEIDANRGADLLSMAATLNAAKCAEVLLKNGWDVNHQKRHGSRNTPLLDAVFHGSVDVVRVLLDANANVDLQNKWQETAIDIATKLFGFHSLQEMVGIVLRRKSSASSTPRQVDDAAAGPEPMQSETE